MDKRQVAIRNNVRIRGEGDEVLLFAHGFGCDQTIWNQVIDDLKGDYRIVTFDYVGCGDSDFGRYINQRYESLDGYARDLIDVVETIDADSMTLIGHSVSGSIACLAYPSIKHKVKRMIMLNPSPRYIHDPPEYQSGFSKEDVDELMVLMEQNFFGWAQYLSPQVMENADRPSLAKTLEKYFTAGDAQLTRNFAKATFYSDVRDTLEKIDCPVDILQAHADIVVPLNVSEYMAQKLPNATMHVLDAKGHYPQLSAPQLIAEHIESAQQGLTE